MVPSGRFVCVQPVSGSQASVVQGLPSSQFRIVPAQSPFEHLSESVQALPSSQPPEIGVALQPLAGSQLSIVHSLPSLQTRVVPSQLEPLHASFTVHSS